jgi:hypothetical protein
VHGMWPPGEGEPPQAIRRAQATAGFGSCPSFRAGDKATLGRVRGTAICPECEERLKRLRDAALVD